MSAHPEMGAALFAYACGGLLHLAMDVGTPMGVPIIHPQRRVSLHLYETGNLLAEAGLVLACFALAALTISLR